MSRHNLALMRLIAALGHVPTLWLVYRWLPDPPTRRLNAWAIAATLAAMAAAGALAEPWWAGALGAWAVGHLAWGLVLAGRVPGPA